MQENNLHLPDLLHTVTNTRINDKWLVKSKYLKKALDDFPADSKFSNFVDTFTFNGVDNSLYQQCFLQVVTETVYDYPTTFFSEKTVKPILNKRPFVLVGPVGSLANLKSMGFKTFSDYWDESYDTVSCPEKRINAIVDIVEWTCNQSLVELQNLCIAMQDVLNYNFNYYVNDFKKNQLAHFEQACIKNLEPRYDTN